MPGENHDSPPPQADLPDPIRRAMMVHAHIQSEAAWWVFGISAYAARPTDDARLALLEFAHDLVVTTRLADAATTELIEWIEELKAEQRG